MTTSLEGRALGIYHLRSELGRGGMGTVYEAESTAAGPAGDAGSVVAVKVFHPELLEEPRALERFELEAAIGRRILHPHLVRTYYLGRHREDDATHNYIVMELIQGQTLKGLLKELGTYPAHLLYAVAGQVLSALEEIHRRGVVHRDVKPENIVITPEHRVLLMDLGLALQHDRRHFADAGQFVGSLIYAPPEQFEGQIDVGPRADLYALGVSLFELATGSVPFSTTDLNTLLQQKLHQDAPPPRSVHPDLDDFLDQVIATSMRRVPADRFASAGEMRRILEGGEASEWWQHRSAGRRVVSADAALRRLRMDRAVRMAGRDDAYARLRAAYGERAASGGAILLAGPAGIGKSRMLYEFLESLASADGPAVVAGRCRDPGEATGQPLAEALRDLVSADEDEGPRRERLAELLADTPGAVEPMTEFLEDGRLREGFAREALHAACARILVRASAVRPVVVVVEDLHQAGDGTLDMLAAVARGSAGHPVALVATYRGEEVEPGSRLARFAEEVGPPQLLGPLDFAATETLVRSVVGREATVHVLAHDLHARSEGNPLTVVETLHDLRSGGHMEEHADGLEFVGSADAVAVPTTQRDLAALRLGRLGAQERETLDVAAVLGVEFEAALFAAVLGIPDIELLKRLAVLERRHRLLVSSGKDRFRFATRQLHDAVYEAIDPGARYEHHALVADRMLDRIREAGSPTPEEAYHLLRHVLVSDRALLAEPWLDAAVAYVSTRQHASRAAPFLEKVLSAVPQARPETRFGVAMARWRLLDVLGDVPAQLQALEAARAEAETTRRPGLLAQVRSAMAGTLWRAGEHAEAGEEARRGLALAREAGDRTWEANALHVLGAVAHHRGNFPEAARRWREALAIRRDMGDRRGEASSLQALGAVMPLIGEKDAALETKQASLEIYREIGDRGGEGALLNNIANSLVDAQRLEEALEYFDRALAISRELGKHLSEAMQLSNSARAQYVLGRVEEARDAFERALELFRLLNNRDGEIAVLLLVGPSLAYFGDYDKGEEYLRAALAKAEAVGAKAGRVAAHRELAIVLHEAGRRDEAWEHVEKAVALEVDLASPESHFLTLASKGVLALREEKHDEAAALLEAGLGRVEGGRDAHGLLMLCRLARAHAGAGRKLEAAEAAARAGRLDEELGLVGPSYGPEVHYTLARFAGAGEARDRHLA